MPEVQIVLTLAQDAAAKPWWQFVVEQAFGLTILFIFVAALIGVLFKQWHKDKCLKLLHGFHVCLVNTSGRATWGDLTVYSKGVELTFDAPYRNRRGLLKTSALIYETQMPECLALCRSNRSLSKGAQRRRARQIRRSFKPGLFRRSWRWTQNLINTFRDAFARSLTAFIGQVAKSKQDSVIAQQREGVLEIGDTLLGVAGNAYEPILERHIGHPVVLELKGPADAKLPSVEVPGYLVDYTDKYLAVFNVEHRGLGVEEVVVTSKHETPAYTAELIGGRLSVTCHGPEFLTVVSLRGETMYAEPGVVLPHGSRLDLSVGDAASITLKVEPTRRIDIVCPRSQATIRFGGDYAESDKRRTEVKDHGIAPEAEESK